MEDLESDEKIETYNFQEFSLTSPWLSEKKKLLRVSSFLLKVD
jgi:hypothetical protein